MSCTVKSMGVHQVTISRVPRYSRGIVRPAGLISHSPHMLPNVVVAGGDTVFWRSFSSVVSDVLLPLGSGLLVPLAHEPVGAWRCIVT